MGFGWMFIGYFFMFSTALSTTGGFDFLPDAIGFAIMLHGVKIASEHCERFDLTRNMCGFGIFFSLLYTAYQLLTLFEVIALSPLASGVIYWAYTAFIAGFNICLLLSIAGIAFETGVERLRRRAVTGMILCGLLFFGGRLLGRISMAQADAIGVKTANYLYSGGFIAETVFIVYMLVTIFSCYMRICLEGDEDMPDTKKHRLPSPFEIYENGKKNGGGKR